MRTSKSVEEKQGCSRKMVNSEKADEAFSEWFGEFLT